MNPKTATLLATFFYLGKAPKAPGTVGTFGALPVVLLFAMLGSLGYMLAAFLFTLFAIFVSHVYETHFDGHDHKEIVIDEVAGFVIAMTWLPLSWQSFLMAFLLFRLFDIWKPFPISWLDQKVQGGLGVVVDDVAAGLVANVILQAIFTQTSWLGYQLGG